MNIEDSKTWDRNLQIDFMVLSIPGFRPRAVAVQTTNRPDDYSKISGFATVQRSPRALTDRALYMEVLVPSSLIDDGVIEVIALALKQFQTDRSILKKPIAGVKIFADGTYEFFDLDAALSNYATTLAKPPQPSPPSKGLAVAKTPVLAELDIDTSQLAKALMGDKNARSLQGVLMSYRPMKGFGTALSKQGHEFFVHIYNVLDPDLRDRLGKMTGDTPLHVEIPITFEDGGKTKPDAKNNEAKKVYLLR
jgi:hypothetical protein